MYGAAGLHEYVLLENSLPFRWCTGSLDGTRVAAGGDQGTIFYLDLGAAGNESPIETHNWTLSIATRAN
jgi:hypothetical protein